MTVTQTQSWQSYIGNGAANEWAFPFPIYDEEHLLLFLDDGESLTQVASEDYSVILLEDETAEVTYPLAEPLANGQRIVLIREVPIQQGVSIKNQQRYYADVVERVFNRLTLISQQLDRDVGRALKVNFGDDAPDSFRIEPNTVLAFDEAGKPKPGPTVTEVSNAQGYAEAAISARDDAQSARDDAEGFAEAAASNSRLQIGTVEQGAAAASITGDPGDQNLNLTIPGGWSPVFSLVSDGDRRVLHLSDWVGGHEEKPTTEGFVGSSGLVATAAEAVNVRGSAGEGSGDMLSSIYDPENKQSDVFARGNHTGTQAVDTMSLTGPGLVGRGASGAGAAGLIDSAAGLTGAVAGLAALATPSGASNWAPDWEAFISADWEVTNNRTLSNPTSVTPGTTRVVRIRADDATERTISYGSNYYGDLNGGPVTDDDQLVLSLFAVASDFIVVSALEVDAS